MCKFSGKNSGLYLFFLVFVFSPFLYPNNLEGKIMSHDSHLAIVKETFGKTSDGRQADVYTLTNKNGMIVKITNFGGAVISLQVPDKDGEISDVVLGYDDVTGYEKDNSSIGFSIGRYANRIGKAKFTLDGTEYKLSANDGVNTLHGGKMGFSHVLWQAKTEEDQNSVSLILTYNSKDGDQGFPGNLTATVKFTLGEKNELHIDYSAITDKTTVVNLTNHSYFNLAGPGDCDVLSHELMINADAFTPIDSEFIATGEIRKVAGTPFDFRKPKEIGKNINEKNEQIIFGKGYDHNWVLNKQGNEMSLAARVYEPKSGRVLEVLTTEPGVQFYSGNFLDGTVIGRDKKVYKHRFGFCLETQHFPDSPNKPDFPSVVLKKGDIYKTSTVFKFSVEK